MTEREAWVDHIPVVWVEPATRRPDAGFALWLPHLTGVKEDYLPVLRQLAAAGFVAASLDPWQHGERGDESRDELAARVFGDFRRHMWPILGQTTLDALRVLDWAAATLDTGRPVVAGGVSMGGDIAVALAGADHRVGRVAAVVANPDWTRPGMRHLRDPGTVLPQPPADSYAQWFYDRLDPLSHLDRYAHGPAIVFHCGADDTHVPPDGALGFQEAWRQAYPRHAGEIQVELHAGRGHLDAATDRAIIDQSVAWLAG